MTNIPLNAPVTPVPNPNGAGHAATPLNTGFRGTSAFRAYPGVLGVNTGGGDAVFGQAEPNGRGVVGVSDAHTGIEGNTRTGMAVFGIATDSGRGVVGVSDAHTGVEGNTKTGSAVFGIATGAGGRAVVGISQGGGLAGFFDGNVEVTGDLFLAGADYAEAMTTTDLTIIAGNVVVLGEDGEVRPCDQDYDSAVAGIVSGAGGVKPAIILDRHDDSVTVAMMGKVWCFADADAAPIRPGDLLTSSSTRGHCRRVTEPARAFGAVVGKALTPLASGQGLVRVLVSPL